MPFYFELELGRSQVETGLLMTPWPVAVGVAAPIAGRLSDRVPAAILGCVGLAALAIGLVLLARLPLDASFVDIAWPMALCGAGFGFFQAPNNRTLLSVGAASARRGGGRHAGHRAGDRPRRRRDAGRAVLPRRADARRADRADGRRRLRRRRRLR